MSDSNNRFSTDPISLAERYAPDLRDAILELVRIQQISRSPRIRGSAECAECDITAVLRAFSEIGPGPKRVFENLGESIKAMVEKSRKRQRKAPQNRHGFSGCHDIRLPYVVQNERLFKLTRTEELPKDSRFLIMGPSSPKPLREAVENLARYFKREQGFNSSFYTANETQEDPSFVKDRVLVFYKDEVLESGNVIYPIGAVGIRWRKCDDHREGWSIAWAWFHPYERRKGHLTGAWPFILKTFPDPWVEAPLSDAMEQFLRKMNYTRPLQGPNVEMAEQKPD